MARPLAALVDPYRQGPDITPPHASSRRAEYPSGVDEDASVEVSVCIPVLNAAPTIADQLAALSVQEADFRWEVVLADNGSVDDTVAIARQFSQQLELTIVDASMRSGINAARNAAVRASSGRLLAFCDGDDQVQLGWLAAMARGLHSFDGVGGDSIVVSASGPTGEIIGSKTVLGFLPSPLGANCGVRRAAYDEIGGFDESFVAGSDEYDFFLRLQEAGLTVGHLSDARVLYRQSIGSARQEFRRARMRGLQQAHLYAKHRNRGMSREPTIDVLRVWAHIAKGLFRSIVHPDAHFTRTVGVLGRRLGRVQGSIRFGCIFL